VDKVIGILQLGYGKLDGVQPPSVISVEPKTVVSVTVRVAVKVLKVKKIIINYIIKKLFCSIFT